MFVAADTALADLVGDVPIVTDNHPRIEYFNFYPIDPMGYDEVVEHREPVEAYLVAPPGDPSALRVAQEIQTSIWREHEASAAGRQVEARQFLEFALTRAPQNRYLRYLHAQHQRRLN